MITTEIRLRSSGAGWWWLTLEVGSRKYRQAVDDDDDDDDVNFLNVTQTDPEGVNRSPICIYDADGMNETTRKAAYRFSLWE